MVSETVQGLPMATSAHLVRNSELAALPQQGSHDGVLRVGMDACSCIAQLVGVVEEGSARRLLQGLVNGPAEEGASRQGEDEDVFRGNAFLLHARGSEVDLFPV